MMLAQNASLLDIAQAWPLFAVLSGLLIIAAAGYKFIYRPEVERRAMEKREEDRHRVARDLELADIRRREIQAMEQIAGAQRDTSANLAQIGGAMAAQVRINESMTGRLERVAERMEAIERRGGGS